MRIASLDESPQQCVYLPDCNAHYESFFVLEATPQERELLLSAGYRSFGKYYFRPRCVGCHQCVPIRLPVAQFRPSKSQRRVWKRCSVVDVVVDKPHFTQEKFEIYKDHLRRFPEIKHEGTPEGFAFSFYDSDTPAVEFCYYIDGTLAAVGIVGVTPHALSSVYFMYRLEYTSFSLGTYSVMAEIDHARRHDLDYLYLGYYIKDNPSMNYKARFYPNEVLQASGRWVTFHDASGHALLQDPPDFIPFPVLDR